MLYLFNLSIFNFYIKNIIYLDIIYTLYIMTKPKNKPRTKTKRRRRKDKNDPKNMNTNALYLMAQDYENTNTNNGCNPDPIPYTFYDINNASLYDIYSCTSPKPTGFVCSNSDRSHDEIFSSYNAADLNTAVCEKPKKARDPKMTTCIDSNIVSGYLNNIKKRNYFYKL